MTTVKTKRRKKKIDKTGVRFYKKLHLDSQSVIPSVPSSKLEQLFTSPKFLSADLIEFGLDQHPKLFPLLTVGSWLSFAEATTKRKNKSFETDPVLAEVRTQCEMIRSAIRTNEPSARPQWTDILPNGMYIGEFFVWFIRHRHRHTKRECRPTAKREIDSLFHSDHPLHCCQFTSKHPFRTQGDIAYCLWFRDRFIHRAK